MITIIVARAKNGVIGNSNDIPWHIPRDLKHFASKTRGQIVAMGQKTFESIITRLGHPLPDRQTIILSLDKNFSYPGCTVFNSFDDMVREMKNQDIFIAGGAMIYKIALPYADKLLLTEVDAVIEGDARFDYDSNEWIKISEEFHAKDEKNQFDVNFCVYERKK